MGHHSIASYGGSNFALRDITGDDITIAQGLLAGNPTAVAPMNSSFYRSQLDMNQQIENLPPDKTLRRSRYNATSNTWTSSSGEVSDTDDIGDRTFFIQSFNKIANQYGISELIPLIPDTFQAVNIDQALVTGKQGSGLVRRLLKRTSSMLSMSKPKPEVKHRRSISDLSLRMVGVKKDALKDRHLAEIVRLCGSSPFYLPIEYAPGTLNLPTCFRATAQYLVQRGPAMRGIFRISGSHATVTALYDHYASQDEDGDVISDTVRCPTLPENIEYDEHDVASTFKKFLSGLPGGILGKVWLFDALVAICDQMGADPEFTKTRHSKVRARLIACAISSISSRFQRDLICAVFGLLCMIGRASEIAHREDVDGRPLPTNELMGYGSLGTIFGPLLLGKLIEEHNLIHGEAQDRISPKKKSKHKKAKSMAESLLETKVASDKLRVANRVAEMLITHWRDVVRHMKSLNNISSSLVQHHLHSKGKHSLLHPSASETFFLHRRPDWDPTEESSRFSRRNDSPTPPPRNPLRVCNNASQHSLPDQAQDVQPVRMRRTRPKVQPRHKLSSSKSMGVLTPPREDGNEIRSEHLECACRVPKATDRAVSDLPATENETISSGDSLYQDLLTSVQIASQDGPPPGLHFAAGSALSRKPLSTDGWFIESRDTVASKSQKEQAQIEAKLPRDPTEDSAFNGSINNTIVEATRDVSAGESNKANGEPAIEAKSKRGLVDRKFKSISIESDSHKIGTAQKTHTDSDTLLRVTHLVGQSPSEHLERMLSANISEAIVSLTPLHRSTGSAYRSTGSSNIGASPRASLKSSEGRPWHHRTKPSSMAGVSHEQDMASLASLAQVLMSDNNGDNNWESHSLDPTLNTINSASSQGVVDYSNTKLKPKCGERVGARSREADNSTAQGQFAADSPTVETQPLRSVARLKELPTTPRIPAADPAMTPKGQRGGIKSLIGKFNSVDQEVGTISFTPPARSPVPGRRKYDLQAPGPVLAAYTWNPTPTLNFIRWRQNDAIDASQEDINMEALSPKTVPAQLGLTGFHAKSASFSTLSLVERRPRDADSDQDMGHISNPGQFKVSPARYGGGNGNYGIPGQLGAHTICSRSPRLPKSDKTAITPRPRSTPVSSDLQPFINPRSSNHLDRADLKQSVPTTIPAPSTSIAWTGSQGKGTSTLFSQITNLQRLLESRTEEADNLRKLLHTKGSLNDLSTLAEQLREAKREIATWQKRAETAERHLERLSQLTPVVMGDTMDEEPRQIDTDAIQGDVRELYMVEEPNFHTLGIIGPSQCGDVDGARSSEGSTDTQGTVLRTISKHRVLPGECPLDDAAAIMRTVRNSRESSGDDLISFPEIEE